jgi:hypothetical protein
VVTEPPSTSCAAFLLLRWEMFARDGLRASTAVNALDHPQHVQSWREVG